MKTRDFATFGRPSTRGAEKNFLVRLADQARAPLFPVGIRRRLMARRFSSRKVSLRSRPSCNASATGSVRSSTLIFMQAKIVRSYPSFRRFQSTMLKPLDLMRFLWEPEIMGKANLIYSIFRRPTLSDAIEFFREHPLTWGSDMNLVYGYLCRY